MNQYPLWKYLLLIAVISVGTLYALPNLYPSDPAIFVSTNNNQPVNENIQERVQRVLSRADITPRADKLEAGKLLVRFESTDDQLEAAELVKRALGRNYIVALNLAPSTPQWLRDLGADPMYLGLDLRGGVHFLMEVNMPKVLRDRQEDYVSGFKKIIRENKIYGSKVNFDDQGRIKIQFEDAAALDQGEPLLRKDNTQDLEFERGTENDLYAVLKESTQTEIKRQVLKQNITTLRKRVNELGVSEPIIQQQGLERIVVQLPGIQDPARAKEVLGAQATLEFRLVDEEADPFAALNGGRIPPTDRLYKTRDGQPYLLKRKIMLTGDYITDAASGFDSQGGGSIVSITLDGKGASIWSKTTGANVKKLMAVVFIEEKNETYYVDGEPKTRSYTTEDIINVARIQERLSKRFQISGLDSPQEAAKLALLLRAGSLAAPMQIVEERTVGPSLGKANIEQGFKSVVLGFVLVMVFMLLYYRLFGMVANIALAANLVIIIAVLSMLQATLTLPGIAGIVLTVGMAVDANVLIFERIREELRNGMSPQAAIKAGYERAFSTIADANITTLIAALVLYGFGTGPIKGFAITLSIGILSSMFTAIMGTRAVINLIYGSRRINKLSI